MWSGSWWVAMTCVAVATKAHYSDYSNAKMPEYAGGDYDSSRDSRGPALDYYRDQAAAPLHPQETHSSDYKYEEETGKSRKHVDLDDAEMWQNPTKNKNSGIGNKPGTLDYNSDEIEFKLSNRLPKYRPRNKMRGSQDDDAHRYPVRYGRYEKKDASDINTDIDFQNDDRKIYLHDDNSDYSDKSSHRGTTARIIRRKPRDRYVKPLVADAGEANTPKSEFIDDERNSGPRNSIPLERQNIKRVGADLVKSNPKVKQYGEYDDYYDMKRVLGVKQKLSEQDEVTDAHSNINAPDLPTETTRIADWWLRRSGGGNLAAERRLSHTSMKQMEDSLKEDLSFPNLYLITHTADSLNTVGYTLPNSPYLRKHMGSTFMKNHELEPYLKKKKTKDEIDTTTTNLVTKKETTEQDLELPYSQQRLRKQMADTAKDDFKFYLRKRGKEVVREKQNEGTAYEPFKRESLVYFDDDIKVTTSESDQKEFELPLKRPSHEDQAANIGKKSPDARPSHSKQIKAIEEKDFELPYTKPSHTREIADNEYKEFKVPNQRPSTQDQMTDPKNFDTRMHHTWPSHTKGMANSEEKDFELPYTRPSHTREIADKEYKEFKLPDQQPNSHDQRADPKKEYFDSRPSYKSQKANTDKNNFKTQKPFPTDTEQTADTQDEEFEIPNSQKSFKQHIKADDKKGDLSSLREQNVDSEKVSYVMAYSRPSVRGQMAEARKKGFGMPNLPGHRGQIANTEEVDYEMPKQWDRLRGPIAEVENKDLRIPNPQLNQRDQITETEQEDYENSQSNLEDEIVRKKTFKMARPNSDKEKNSFRGEWTNLLDEPFQSTENIQLFSEGRRNFEDSANSNNIADYGNYNYDTETTIFKQKAKNEKTYSLALKSFLNTTTTKVTTTTPFTSTTATGTFTSAVPDLVIVDEVRGQSDADKLELSLAEKSRMSILKKSLRKEMSKDTGTTKPPVLMQVTNKLYTMVMVEPPTSPKPWQRVHVVSDDSPDHLKDVKRLMRHKLIANAKNVHDLTENWDDMVCDYVDMSLLNDMKRSGATVVSMANYFTIILSFSIIKYYSSILEI